MSGVLAQAAPPSARAVRWTPLAVAGLVLVGTALLSRAADRPTDMLAALAAAVLASLLVASLHDPARDLLAPVPVSAMRRRVLRLALVAVPVLLIWGTLVLLAGTTSDATSHVTGTGSLLALAATGVAAAVWAGPRTGVGVGAAVPALWFVLDQATPSGLASNLVGLWRTDPWPVAAAALLLCVLGRRR